MERINKTYKPAELEEAIKVVSEAWENNPTADPLIKSSRLIKTLYEAGFKIVKIK